MFGNFRILYVSNESLVIMANPSKRKLKISSKTDKDNVAVTKSRKRQCSDYHQVEDDIQFIVKKQKRECEIVMKSLKESSKAVQNQKKSELESCVSTNPSVDNREINRRSPNGFLLPDPLPRGEVLVDTIKQKWIHKTETNQIQPRKNRHPKTSIFMTSKKNSKCIKKV